LIIGWRHAVSSELSWCELVDIAAALLSPKIEPGLICRNGGHWRVISVLVTARRHIQRLRRASARRHARGGNAPAHCCEVASAAFSCSRALLAANGWQHRQRRNGGGSIIGSAERAANWAQSGGCGGVGRHLAWAT